VLTLAAYLPTAWNDFVNYDDSDYVTENAHVKSGLTWETVAWAFRTGHASNWHPLTWLSHALDCQVFGVKPGAMHLVSVALHVANTDRRALAKCPGGGAIRAAPVARGIGGLGVGTQGRAEHALLPAHDMGVWVLREGPKSEF
jgi:hypothetical protein